MEALNQRIRGIRKYPLEARLAFIVLFIGIALRFAIASYTVEGGDPCYHLSAARFIGRNLQIPLFEPLGREIFAHEPLFHLTAAPFYIAFEQLNLGDFGMHLVSPIFGSLSLVFSYLISRKLFNRKIALYALIFTAFIPLHIYHSTTAHIDMAAAFFVTLSVYLAVNGSFYGSSAAFGLSVLGRINSVFLAPFHAFMIIRRNKGKYFKILKLLAIFFFITFLILLPWYARNYALLHNPVWPFLNSFFGGYYSTGHDRKPDKIGHMLDFKDAYVEVFLALFGVPDGKYESLFLFGSSALRLIVIGFIIFAFFSLIPILFWLFNKPFREKNVSTVLWIVLPFIFFLYFYQLNYANTSTRYILGAIPFIGILWGLGIDRISKIASLKVIWIFLVSFIVVFSASEAVKTGFITMKWKSMYSDIEWMQKNTPKDALFIAPGQCFGYRLDRSTYPPKGMGYALKPSLDPKIEEIDYIINADNAVQKPIPRNIFKDYLPYFEIIYRNEYTNFEVYGRKAMQ